MEEGKERILGSLNESEYDIYETKSFGKRLFIFCNENRILEINKESEYKEKVIKVINEKSVRDELFNNPIENNEKIKYKNRYELDELGTNNLMNRVTVLLRDNNIEDITKIKICNKYCVLVGTTIAGIDYINNSTFMGSGRRIK